MPAADPPDSASPVLLATYGTLMTGQINPLSPAARARMRSLGTCLLPGRLFEIRERSFVYPAVVLDGPADEPPDGLQVWGELFAIGATEAEAALVLAETDAYENCRPGDAARSTYLRQRLRVRLVDAAAGGPEHVWAWVYVYNRPVARAAPLPDGRWRAPDDPMRFAVAGAEPPETP